MKAFIVCGVTRKGTTFLDMWLILIRWIFDCKMRSNYNISQVIDPWFDSFKNKWNDFFIGMFGESCLRRRRCLFLPIWYLKRILLVYIEWVEGEYGEIFFHVDTLGLPDFRIVVANETERRVRIKGKKNLFNTYVELSKITNLDGEEFETIDPIWPHPKPFQVCVCF